ncbi:hypothetical protein HMPREF1142_0133 [Peptostreptococcaceae bacterium AS15]|nr:hypothetical protein HMPREF1142_0133 [Peptostreptococcaceae bacterium AS15]
MISPIFKLRPIIKILTILKKSTFKAMNLPIFTKNLSYYVITFLYKNVVKAFKMLLLSYM